jgi:hypothetical protein
MDVAELIPVSEFIDGAEIYSRICEDDDPDRFIKATKQRASHLLENSMNKCIPLN